MLPIGDNIPARNRPVATWLLIIVNSLAFLVELAIPEPALEELFHVFGLVPAGLTAWALLTSMFIHGGWLHILANMWTLWIFGDNVEDRMGPVRFTIFYLVCGSIAGLTQVLTNPDSTLPSLGASGAIAGVLGAYFLFFPTARLIVLFPIFFFPFFFEVPAVFYLAIWFFSQLFSGTAALAGPQQVGGIAWWAHIGGVVGGMLLCGLFARRRRPTQPDEHALEWAWEP